MKDDASFERKYEQLLCDIYEVYKWIEGCRAGGENIDDPGYRKGYLNRIEHTLLKMECWIDQIKSGEAEQVFHRLIKRCNCAVHSCDNYPIIHNICDEHLQQFIDRKNASRPKVDLASQLNLDERLSEGKS